MQLLWVVVVRNVACRAHVVGCGALPSLQKPDHFEIKADVPGFTKDQINVEVHDGVLTITAEKDDRKEEEEQERQKGP